MKIIATEIPGVLIIEPKVFGDDRGFFMETYQRDRYAQHGIPEDPVTGALHQSRMKDAVAQNLKHRCRHFVWVEAY